MNRKLLKVPVAGLLVAIAGIASAVPVQWTSASGGNDHWYEAVDAAVGSNYTWDQAFTDASSRSYNGMTGYLATVTSQAEQNFLFSQFPNAQAWLGGSDSGLEGTWKWMGGPEAGQTFYVEGQPGSQPGYSYWYGGEPNNAYGTENHLVFNWDSQGRWNDFTGNWGLSRYIVEYSSDQTGSVPEPATLVLVGAGLLLAARRRRS